MTLDFCKFKRTVTTTTLDGIISSRVVNKLPPLDASQVLIKIDCQGSELDIMVGAEFCLAMADAVILELGFSEYNIGAPDAETVNQFMLDNGFTESHALGDICYPGDASRIIQQDRLYLRK